jgi:hypothetical protein
MDRKSQQLGLSFSTACGRLEKQIKFSLVKKAGLDTCFHCQRRIETADELSTEHKQPWQNIDPALFWDLDNIAFSHRRCNYVAGVKGKIPWHSKYDKAPKDMAWCSGHQAFLSVDKFHKNRSTRSGFQNDCIECFSRRFC